MKKILIQIFLFISLIGFSQNNDYFCDYRVTNDNVTNANNRNNMTLFGCSLSENYIRNKLTTLGNDFSNETPIVIDVQFHVVPTHQDDVSECKILQNVANMNSFYNQFNIYFKYTGYDVYLVQPTDETKLHIIISEDGNFFWGDGFGKIVSVSYHQFMSSSPSSVLLHEVGHALGLRHTFFGTVRPEGIEFNYVQLSNPYNCSGTNITEVLRPDFTNYSPRSNHATEHVTRDELSPNYNAYLAGDCVPDTSAQIVGPTTCELPSYDHVYIQDAQVVDIVGEPYDVDFFTINNLMGDKHLKYLTPGQGWKMRSYLEICMQDSILIGTAVNPNGVSSLNKPYYSNIDVDMDNNHIVSIEDDRDHPGYEIVCRPQYLAHKFQKGFEYHIYKVNNGYYFNGDVVNPSDTTLQEVILANADCNTVVVGPRLAVKIPSLSDDIIMFEALPGVRGYYCGSEQVTNTTIY